MTRKRKWIFRAAIIGFLIGSFFLVVPFLGDPPIPLPASARWVQWHEGGAMIAYDLEVKFRAPFDDCLKAAKEIIAADAAKFHITNSNDPIEIRNGRLQNFDMKVSYEMSATSDYNPWWFNPITIRNGIYIPGGGSYCPEIWIDKDRGILFYRVTD